MRKFILIAILLSAFGIGFTSAQTESDTEACAYEFEDGSVDELGEYDFYNCALLLINYAFSEDFYEAYGYWGDDYIYVEDNGDIYYLDEEEEWVYWDTISVESDQDSSSTQTDSSGTLALDELYQVAEFDINVFWTNTFDDYDEDYQEPELVIIEQGDVNSPCGTVGSSTGPVYCGGDNAIYLPTDFMSDQYYRIGDYAVVVIMAHEWGHSVEEQLGFYDQDLVTQETELMADCLAGAYTHYLMNESENAILDDGDVDEAITSLFEAGDDLPWFDEDSHGTGDQRTSAFEDGMDYGVEACIE